MASSQSIEHIQYLIRSEQLDQAQTALSEFLRNAPRNGEAWAIAAQLTSDPQQCREFLKTVFDCSDSTALTDWAFRNLGDLQSEGSVYRLSPPPIESLIVLTDTRIPSDNLLAQAASSSQSTSPIEKATSPVPIPESVPPTPTSAIYEPNVKKTRLPFSVKRLGEWMMLVGGLILIFSVYSESFRLLLMDIIGLSPFYYCFLPLFVLGTLTFLAGFIVDTR
ncbi:MAG: tetratricopeptide repeat protein [Anaerolineae bacterium]|nr:tetratricopeptide repeat protein [Anaerolineae bacterium]